MLTIWSPVRLWRPGIEAAISKHAFPSSWTDEVDATFVTVKKNTNARQTRTFAKFCASATAERKELISLRTISKVFIRLDCAILICQNWTIWCDVKASYLSSGLAFFFYLSLLVDFLLGKQKPIGFTGRQKTGRTLISADLGRGSKKGSSSSTSADFLLRDAAFWKFLN